MEGPGVAAIQRYLTTRLSKISEYASVPSYVRVLDVNFTDAANRQIETINLNPGASPLEIAEILIDSAANIGLTLSNPQFEDPRAEAIRVLARDLSALSPDKLEKYLAPFRVDPSQIRAIQENIELFRVFGPVNPHPEDDFSILTTFENGERTTDYEKIYGGPRMFLSMEYERDNDNDLPLQDWFVGYCYQCLRRIKKRHYAIRRALIRGGWIGCYCSPQCVETSIVFDLGTDEDELKIVELDVNLNREIARMLNQIGIAEREGDSMETEQDEVEQLRKSLPRLSLSQKVEEPVQDILDMLGEGSDIE